MVKAKQIVTVQATLQYTSLDSESARILVKTTALDEVKSGREPANVSKS